MSSIPAKDWKSVWELLASGIREHVRQNGFTDVVLGLSGGMDSALVAALAVDALGKEHVHGVMMPSPWSSEGSITDSEALAANLRMETFTVPISPMMEAFEKALAPAFAGKERDVTEENIQSRIRGVVLMSFSNKYHWMLFATGNKSELAAGYCTMYGDTCGGLAPIADLYKTEVYQLAQWFNEREGMCVIPQNIFDKAPSAELRPGQKDQDSLPAYDVLDSILHALIEESKQIGDIDLPGITPEEVDRVRDLMCKSAFKRLQTPPLLPVGEHAFGVHVHM
ncbi:NAD(+) synthase [uncultured Bilophila sp.]|uniref:NAD(+) synthase n=1 Tax=uncultured Bilophila sp. TaxID=529385 RepID=UPI00280B8292|nr:NAD(+) synthase [uncultured Bilophila sp.]